MCMIILPFDIWSEHVCDSRFTLMDTSPYNVERPAAKPSRLCRHRVHHLNIAGRPALTTSSYRPLQSSCNILLRPSYYHHTASRQLSSQITSHAMSADAAGRCALSARMPHMTTVSLEDRSAVQADDDAEAATKDSFVRRRIRPRWMSHMMFMWMLVFIFLIGFVSMMVAIGKQTGENDDGSFYESFGTCKTLLC